MLLLELEQKFQQRTKKEKKEKNEEAADVWVVVCVRRMRSSRACEGEKEKCKATKKNEKENN